MDIIFNGKILYRKVTGVERYAWETMRALNCIIEKGEYGIAVPGDYDIAKLEGLNNFNIIKISKSKLGFIWDQLTLPIYARKRKCIIVNLDFTNSILFPGISTIHDMSFIVNKEFFKNTFKQKIVRLKLRLYCSSTIKSRCPIFTVTNFQKNEICKYYKISPDRITVAGNGWQHLNRLGYDDTIFEQYHIQKGEYYLALSSNTPNKNFRWIYEVSQNNTKSIFVIVGGNTSISEDDLSDVNNILYLGYQSDQRVKSLYKHCKAFIFPSLYEGFGIPPLEALSVGARIIISNQSCLPEIYGNSAIYINPYDYSVNLNELVETSIVDYPYNTLNKYSWEKTAIIWHSVLSNIGKGT